MRRHQRDDEFMILFYNYDKREKEHGDSGESLPISIYVPWDGVWAPHGTEKPNYLTNLSLE